MTDQNKPQFTEPTMALVEKIIKRYPEGRQKSALLPILHLAQAEFGGWLSPETMDYVASILDLKPIEGEHFQTENEYEIFVYYRAMGSRYDELIGYSVLNPNKRRL